MNLTNIFTGATCFVVSLHAGMYSIEDVLTEEEQLMVQI